MKMEIRKLRTWKRANEPWFTALDRATFTKDSRFENGPNYHWWVVYVKREIVAFAGLYIDGTAARFCRCGVLKKRRGLGIQRELIKVRWKWCRTNRGVLGLTKVLTYTSRTGGGKISGDNLESCGFSKREFDEQWNIYSKEF